MLAVAVQRVLPAPSCTRTSRSFKTRVMAGAWCARTKCKMVSGVSEAASFSGSSASQRPASAWKHLLEQAVVARQVVPGALLPAIDSAGGARRRLGQLLEDRGTFSPISLAQDAQRSCAAVRPSFVVKEADSGATARSLSTLVNAASSSSAIAQATCRGVAPRASCVNGFA